MSKKKNIANLKYILLLFGVLVVITISRLFVTGIYRISSSSMQPTLNIGDYILVNKLVYGPRKVKIWKLLVEKKLDYQWYRGLGVVGKWDLVVFNQPNYNTLYEEHPCVFGDTFIKRCYGLSGDTVLISQCQNEEYLLQNRKESRIDNEKIRIKIEELKANNSETGIVLNKDKRSKRIAEDANKQQLYQYLKFELFPYDSSLGWTLYRYGPLFVPGKGKIITLTAQNEQHYKDILKYEGYTTLVKGDSVFLNGIHTPKYTFKENYYFMLGDNFYNSYDSRYWGFVPQKNIIGKAVLVLFSLDPDEPWYRKFRWNRFFKKVE